VYRSETVVTTDGVVGRRCGESSVSVRRRRGGHDTADASSLSPPVGRRRAALGRRHDVDVVQHGADADATWYRQLVGVIVVDGRLQLTSTPRSPRAATPSQPRAPQLLRHSRCCN